MASSLWVPSVSMLHSSFGTLLSQNARLITLETVQEGDLPESFVVEQFTGREAVNDLFSFDVDVVSLSADVDLKQFIGEEMTLRLLRADGTKRAWHGYCTEASWMGADGGISRYRLRLAPFLALLALRRDSFIFQDKTVTEIVDELLADYPQSNFKFDISRELAPRAICTQYRENDLDFFRRVLASEGLSWYFTHEQGDATSAQSSSSARHQLVVCDASAKAPVMDNGVIRFHRVAATEQTDSINRFAATRQLQANAVTVSGWNPAQLVAPSAEIRSTLAAGEVPDLSIYSGAANRHFLNAADASQRVESMLQAVEAENKIWEGGGAVRDMAAGHVFSLIGHDHYPHGDNAFKVVWTGHAARNNLGHGIPSLKTLDDTAGDGDLPIEHGIYRNTFGCVREAVPIVPRAAALPDRPTVLGPQIAYVVGLAEAALTTTRDHQIKLQFPWQRGERPASGGLAHGGTDVVEGGGNAPGDERSGTWVRVSEALAGPNWGTVFVPRIGTEVLVDFVGGDIDCPVVVAQLYNGVDVPPFAAGVDGGVNHAGALSGWHSAALDKSGSGYNQWVVDDSASQLRMRLSTSSAASQVNLGYLVHQRAASAQRGSYRGSGFEVRTDAWGVVRAAQGMLLSTSARLGRGDSVTSTQMDAAEAVALLAGAGELTTALTEAAAHQQALWSQVAGEGLDDMAAMIDPARDGRHAATVNGQKAQQAQPGGRTLDAAKPVEKLAEAAIVLDSAASMNWASAASTLLYAGGPLQCSAQGDMHWMAAQTASCIAGEATTFFAHDGGIQAIAANGPLSLQAHTGALEVLADDAITMISVKDVIEVKASKVITLQAGQASVTLEGGDITFACPGQFSVKGATHPFSGPDASPPMLETLPDRVVPHTPPEHSLFEKYDEQFVYKDSHGDPISDIAFNVQNRSDEAQKLTHRTPDTGIVDRIDTANAQPLEYALQYAAFQFAK